MDYAPEGTGEALIPRREKTASRTRTLLVVARLCFVFSHGLLVISASAAMGSAGAPWWAVFLPAWLGDGLCVVLCVLSWFASCPYIQLCLSERQARYGDHNPSILIDILPDIVWAIFGCVFVFLAFAGEVMLCRSLHVAQRGERPDLWPCAVLFITAAVLASCRGVLVRAGGEFFAFFGLAVIGTCVAALSAPSRPYMWVLVLPSLVSTCCLFLAAVRRLRRCRRVLCREERLLSIAEQVVLLLMSATLACLAFVLRQRDGDAHRALATQLGVLSGCGICLSAALRARLALIEGRIRTVSERLIVLGATPLDPPHRYFPAAISPQRSSVPSSEADNESAMDFTASATWGNRQVSTGSELLAPGPWCSRGGARTAPAMEAATSEASGTSSSMAVGVSTPGTRPSTAPTPVLAPADDAAV